MKALLPDDCIIGSYYAVCERIEGHEQALMIKKYGDLGRRYMSYSNSALYKFAQCIGFEGDVVILKMDNESVHDAYLASLYSSRIYYIYDAIDFCRSIEYMDNISREDLKKSL